MLSTLTTTLSPSSSSSTLLLPSTQISTAITTTAKTTTTTDDVLLDELSRLSGLIPVQPHPIIVPPDMSYSALRSTSLNGHFVSCFVVGGECRICFPQIISVVLQNVPIREVNELFITLNIHISVATPQQLDTLKFAGVMPMTVDSCGLITKSDAERLVAKLVPQSGGPLRTSVSRDGDVSVSHDCFGGCVGRLITMISATNDDCIECDECKFMFTGEKFVTHTHSLREIHKTCHWGFDSANWRHFIYLTDESDDPKNSWASQLLQQFKNYSSNMIDLLVRPVKRHSTDAKVSRIIFC